MILKQTGWIVRLTRMLGGIFTVISIIYLLVVLVVAIGIFFQYFQSGESKYLLIPAFGIPVNLVIASAFWLFGTYLWRMFPDILIGSDGLKIKSKFVPRLYDWRAVDGIIQVNKNIRAILLPGNREFILLLYGWFWIRSFNQPIILILNTTTNVDLLVSHINK